MPKGGAVIVIDARCFEGFVADCARTLDKPEDRAHDGIAGVGLNPLVLVRQFDANRTVEECLHARGRSGVFVTPHMVTNSFQGRGLPIWEIFMVIPI